MSNYFEDLRDIVKPEEVSIKFPGFDWGCTYNEIYNSEYDLCLQHRNNKWWAVHEEEEEDYHEEEARIYTIGCRWWSVFDLDRFLKDVEDGKVTPEDFYLEEYE